MLRLKTFLPALLAALLLVQPVSAETQPPTEREPDIVTAVLEVDTIPTDISPAGAPTWLQTLIAAPLYKMETGSWIPVLASALPEDVTVEYAGTYGIPENTSRGYAFRVALSSDARREDGNPITADDYLAVIRSDLENWAFLANAQEILDEKHKPGSDIISLKQAGFTGISEAWEAGYTDFYINVDGFWGLSAGWRTLSDRSRMRDFAMPSYLDEAFVSSAYLYSNYLMDGRESSYFQRDFIGVSTAPGPVYTMDDLGLIKETKHSMILIFQTPATPSTVASKLSGLMVDGSASYGPYRITEAGENLLLEPNPHWWGEADSRGYARILCRKIGS